MKAKFTKIFLSTALMISFAPAAGLTDVIPVEAASHINVNGEANGMPSNPIAKGTDGVKWAIDANMVLYFETGWLGKEGNWKRNYQHQIKEIRVVPNAYHSKLILPESCTGLFSGFNRLTKIDTALFDTSNVSTMDLMFNWCCSLRELDLSSFSTRNVCLMLGMFSDCRILEKLDLSHFDTSGMRDYSCYDMFENCFALKKIHLSKGFFKGPMSVAAPFTEETRWVPLSNPEHARTWAEMDDDWDDKESGWWCVDCSRLDWNVNGGTEIPALYERTGGSIDISKYIPDRPGHNFTGWYLDPECTEKADRIISMDSDKTVYAGWQIQKKTLTFDSLGGTEMDPVTLDYGSTVDLNSYLPQRDEYRFTGWYTDPKCVNPSESTIILESDTTLYAGWVPESWVMLEEQPVPESVEALPEITDPLSGDHADEVQPAGDAENIADAETAK
ncbi:MAG: InlB B-repeat-containing protein [Erysipelotrichaceae bacterium]|nr:InlB B-repeat-containing protein [Erysipelotrichaceae bacterium]